MSKTSCIVEGCETEVPQRGSARGMCTKHYHRWQRYGDPNIVYPRGWRGWPQQRFWEKVDKSGPVSTFRPDLGPCWLWTGANNDGYGVFGLGPTPLSPTASKRLVPAHQFSYELAFGTVPKGLELDHLCRVHACVNPNHLDPVTHRDNVLRGASPAAEHARKMHCPRGHVYDKVRTDGKRRCSTCDDSNEAARAVSIPTAPCACGCGQLVRQKIRNGRRQRFIHGHNSRSRSI